MKKKNKQNNRTYFVRTYVLKLTHLGTYTQQSKEALST